MQLIEKSINISVLSEMSEKMFDDLVKVVVDIEKEIIALDFDLHSDLEKFLLEKGSTEKNLWGINLYPSFFNDDSFIEFDSMINLRPALGNRTRSVDDELIQTKIIKIIRKKVIQDK